MCCQHYSSVPPLWSVRCLDPFLESTSKKRTEFLWFPSKTCLLLISLQLLFPCLNFFVSSSPVACHSGIFHPNSVWGVNQLQCVILRHTILVTFGYFHATVGFFNEPWSESKPIIPHYTLLVMVQCRFDANVMCVYISIRCSSIIKIYWMLMM